MNFHCLLEPYSNRFFKKAFYAFQCLLWRVKIKQQPEKFIELLSKEYLKLLKSILFSERGESAP